MVQMRKLKSLKLLLVLMIMTFSFTPEYSISTWFYCMIYNFQWHHAATPGYYSGPDVSNQMQKWQNNTEREQRQMLLTNLSQISNIVHIYVLCRQTLGFYEASDSANVSQHTWQTKCNVTNPLLILCTWFSDGLMGLLALA